MNGLNEQTLASLEALRNPSAPEGTRQRMANLSLKGLGESIEWVRGAYVSTI
jgi:hypothetical protein